MLGASGDGPYRKKALQQTDSWVETVLQQNFQPLSWDENVALTMNQKLAKVAADLHRLAVAFRSEGSKFEGSAKVKDRIVAGVENILEHYNPESPRPGNWYQWLITLPDHLGATAILMQDHLPSTILARLKETLRNELSPELILTGTNASWEARNHIYLALLDNDLNRLERAADYVFRSVRFGPREGIGEDYCYLFHGRIPYAGGYGAGFAETLTEFIYVFDGTPWSIKPIHSEIITNLLLEHTRWFLADEKLTFTYEDVPSKKVVVTGIPYSGAA
jgi:hyaluronate lyase